MKNIIICVMLILSLTSHAESADTPEALADRYIAAVNTKSLEAQKATVDPRCLTNLSSGQKKFLDNILLTASRTPIPKEHSITVQKLSELPYAGVTMVEWTTLKPTHEIIISFKVGERSTRVINQYIAINEGHWFILLPTPNERIIQQLEAEEAALRNASRKSDNTSSEKNETLGLCALLQVDGDGRNVDVYVNDKAQSDKGQCLGTRLMFSSDSPQETQWPRDYLDTFCLQEGTNKITVVYTQKENIPLSQLTISVRTATRTSGGCKDASQNRIFEKQISKDDKNGQFTAYFCFNGRPEVKRQAK